jgi:hypothetical protein
MRDLLTATLIDLATGMPTESKGVSRVLQENWSYLRMGEKFSAGNERDVRWSISTY